jgi:hypothetical protein
MQRFINPACQLPKPNAMLSRFFLLPAALLMLAVFVSCKKNKDSDNSTSLFYGKWKTSYNDTVEFKRENGQNVLIFDESMNPSMPMTTTRPFRYSLGKLYMKMPGGLISTGFADYRELESFSWIVPGQSFTVKAYQWFLFISSTTTTFTFTKIP